MNRHRTATKAWYRVRTAGWKVMSVFMVVAMLLPGFADVALAAMLISNGDLPLRPLSTGRGCMLADLTWGF